MGVYVNPSNEQFCLDVQSPIYVDQSGLISYTNQAFTDRSKTRLCVSRPRRFGKTMAINMLTAYYSKGCDSKELFQNLQIASDPSFERHLNRHNVICLDIQSLAITAVTAESPVDPIVYIEHWVISELKELFPGSISQNCCNLHDALLKIYKSTNETFLFLLDEWDVIYREDRYASIQDKYTQWLKALFKGNDTARCINFVYMTGIFPIPQQKTHSALNNFKEYTMRDPKDLSPYTGFTDSEVRKLCKTHKMPYKEIRKWYNGYFFPGAGPVYCPCSVTSALEDHSIEDYWKETASNEEVQEAYQSELPGIREAVGILLAGEHVEIKQACFKRDAQSPGTAGEFLAQMVHLGYLSYDKSSQTASIANMEVKDVFFDKLEKLPEHHIWKIISRSKQVLEDTLAGKADAVAEAVEFAHAYYSNPLTYNNEAALGSAVALAYQYAWAGDYTLFWEFATGKGYADILLMPVRASSRNRPIVVELKWEKPADTAIQQIESRKYTDRLVNYPEILLVGITYNSDADDPDYKKHTCVIKPWRWQTP